MGTEKIDSREIQKKGENSEIQENPIREWRRGHWKWWREEDIVERRCCQDVCVSNTDIRSFINQDAFKILNMNYKRKIIKDMVTCKPRDTYSKN